MNQEERFIVSGEKLLKAKGVEPDLVDLKAMYDNAISYQENKRQLMDYIKQLKPDFEIDKTQVKEQLEDYVEKVRNDLMTKEYQPSDAESLYSSVYESMEKQV
jgi:hypothetical protein